MITIKTFHKLEDLKIHKLIGDHQTFNIHQILPKIGKDVAEKINRLALKSTKSSGSSKESTTLWRVMEILGKMKKGWNHLLRNLPCFPIVREYLLVVLREKA